MEAVENSISLSSLLRTSYQNQQLLQQIMFIIEKFIDIVFNLSSSSADKNTRFQICTHIMTLFWRWQPIIFKQIFWRFWKQVGIGAQVAIRVLDQKSNPLFTYSHTQIFFFFLICKNIASSELWLTDPPPLLLSSFFFCFFFFWLS